MSPKETPPSPSATLAFQSGGPAQFGLGALARQLRQLVPLCLATLVACSPDEREASLNDVTPIDLTGSESDAGGTWEGGLSTTGEVDGTTAATGTTTNPDSHEMDESTGADSMASDGSGSSGMSMESTGDEPIEGGSSSGDDGWEDPCSGCGPGELGCCCHPLAMTEEELCANGLICDEEENECVDGKNPI